MPRSRSGAVPWTLANRLIVGASRAPRRHVHPLCAPTAALRLDGTAGARCAVEAESASTSGTAPAAIITLRGAAMELSPVRYARTPDGAEVAWAEMGSGPPLLMVSAWPYGCPIELTRRVGERLGRRAGLQCGLTFGAPRGA